MHWRDRRLLGFTLAVAAVAACATAPTPATSPPAVPRTPTPTPAATNAPSPTEVGGLIADWCLADDLEVAHGRIEGAAGSRYTTMTLTLVGEQGCWIPEIPSVELRDAQGATIAGAVPAGGAGPLDFPVGVAATSDVQLAYWCAEQPAEPVTLVYAHSRGDVEAIPLPVEGGPFPAVGDVPTCNGGDGIGLFATEWRLP